MGRKVGKWIETDEFDERITVDYGKTMAKILQRGMERGENAVQSLSKSVSKSRFW